MWTSTLELSPTRVIPTNILGLFWRGAYFSSFAPLQIQNLPRQPLPSTSWVRVRNKLAGICGSDLHQVYGDGDFRISPAALPRHIRTYPGHEVVGEVIEVGEEVQQLGVGDRVILQHTPNCLTAGTQPLCRSCAVGNYNLCENGALPNPQQIGGGWSEEMLLHEQQLFLAPNAMSNEQAVMLEPTAVALRAVLHSLPQAGDRILIIGAGTIGLLILNIIRALAPDTEISILAKHAFQVEQATRMGATHIVYPQDSYTTIQRATGAHLYRGMLGNQTLLGGYDIIYDTVGSPKTVHDALRWARAQANVVMVGLNLHLMRVDLSPIWNQEVNLLGTTGHGMENWPLGTREWRSTFDIASELILHGLIHPERLLTHRFALNDYREALTTAMNKNVTGSIKVAFDYALQPASVVPNVRAAARPRRPLPGTPPRSSAGLLNEPLPTPMPIEPRPVEEPEPVAQQPRLEAGSAAPRKLPELIIPEDGEVTAKAVVPTQEQLAYRSQEKNAARNEVASATPGEQQGREDETTLSFKRPDLSAPQAEPAPEPITQIPDEEQETARFAPIGRVAPQQQPEVLEQPEPQEADQLETEQSEDSEDEVITVRQDRPISLPAQFRQESAIQEPVQEAETNETAAPADSYWTLENVEFNESPEQEAPAASSEIADDTHVESEQEETTASTHLETADEAQAELEHEAALELEQETPAPEISETDAEIEQEAHHSPITSTGDSDIIAEPETVSVTPEEDIAEADTVSAAPEEESEAEHVPTPTQEQIAHANAETTSTPAAQVEHSADMATSEPASAHAEVPSPEQYEFAGPLADLEDAETIPELTYEPDTSYFPEPDFSIRDEEVPHANTDGSELNIDYQQIANASEALPEPESYETTIFDIPPDEQLNWLSSMQETEKEAAVDPGTGKPQASKQDKPAQSQRSTAASRNSKAKKRRR